jgi:FdhD protein
MLSQAYTRREKAPAYLDMADRMDLGSPWLDLSPETPAGVATISHPVVRIRGGHASSRDDQLTVEEPLEIRLGGLSFSVTMRTPGHDEELVAGFLLAERVIHGAADIDTIAPYRGPTESPGLANVMNVLVRSGQACRERLRRTVVTSSSCGLCGRATVEGLLAEISPIKTDLTVPVELFHELERSLSAAQATFEKTGGLHAAGLFDAEGRLLVLREDVGRHNAVDKVIGHMLLAQQLPLDRHILLVSGRLSFEIVQKALVAGIPIVAAVSAPSSLAVQLAIASDMTLIGFLRRGSLNIYAGAHRISESGVVAGGSRWN